MGHGFPDYGVATPTKTIYTFQDIGELAARLGSVVTFDRRGNVMWLDDFEDTLMKWDSNQAMNGARLYQTAKAARSGSFSVKMVTPPVVGGGTYLFRVLPLPVQSKIGFEYSYAMYDVVRYIYARISFYERTHCYTFTLRYDRYNITLAYLNSSGGYTDLPGIVSHELGYHAWNTIKLVVDYENKKYVRALLNENSWDLKDIAPYEPAYTGTPYFYLEARITSRTGAEEYIWLDDVILTQNEP